MPMVLSITLGIPQPLDTRPFVHHTVGCKYIMYLSFLEIYNEEIVDLLVKGKSQVCCKHAGVCAHAHVYMRGGSAASETLHNIYFTFLSP